MAKASSLSKSFKTESTQQTDLADVFSPGKLNEKLTTGKGGGLGGAFLSSLSPSVPPNRYKELTTDAKVKTKLTKEASTLESLMGDIKGALPGGASFGAAFEGIDLMTGFDTLLRIKKDMDSGAFRSLDSRMLNRMLKEVPGFNSILSAAEGYACNLAKRNLFSAAGLGKGNSDYAVNYGYGSALAETILLCLGSDDDLGFIDKMAGFFGFNDAADTKLLKNILKFAALGAKIAIVAQMLGKLGKKVKKSEKRKTLRDILGSYSVNRKLSVAKLKEEAVKFVDFTNTLEKDWYITKRGDAIVGSLDHLAYASQDAISLLQLDPRTEHIAILAKRHAERPVDYRVFVREQYPTVAITF